MTMLTIITSVLNFYLLVPLIIIYAIYKYATWTYTLEEKFGFPGPKPAPFFGNILDFAKDTFNYDIKNQKKFGHIYPIYIGRRGMLMVSDEAIVKQILVKDFRCFVDRIVLRLTTKIAKKGVTQLKGKDWERVRTLLSPTFTSGKMKNMFSIINDSVKHMVDNLPTTTDMESKNVFSVLTMDVIAKTMFGMDLNSYGKTANPFVEYAKALVQFKFATFFFVVADIFNLTGVIEYLFPNGVISPKGTLFLQNSVLSNIKRRQNSDEEHHDFLALMLKAHNELDKEQESSGNKDKLSYTGLTGDEITAQSMVFLIAGYETTASLLTFCSRFLALNRDAQDEIYQELSANIPPKTEITYDVLASLNLLEQALTETLRMCPPVARLSRTCTKDTTLVSSTGQIIQAKRGMCFLIPINAIHYDERLWPDPHKFDIHRFDKDKKNRSQFSFMPFGMGPRMCIGMRFALLEAKLALANLLLKYEIVPCDKTTKHLRLESNFLLTNKDPIVVALRKR